MIQLNQKEDWDSNLCDLGSYFPPKSIFSCEKMYYKYLKGLL